MAAHSSRTGSALLGGVLLAGVFAIIVGIIGMLVMTGTHSMHSLASMQGAMTSTDVESATSDGRASGHSGHLMSSPEPVTSEERVASNDAPPDHCACSGNCSSQHAMAASCIPTVASGGLVAPAPAEAASITTPTPAFAFTAWSHWPYRPGSPSPGELSISRT